MRSRLSTFLMLLSGGVAAGYLAEPPRTQIRDGYQAPLLPRPEFLKLVGASHLSLLADYYWLQAIQSVGGAKDGGGYLDVFHYSNLVTDLDPRFRFAYVFVGSAIPFNTGRERWVNTAEARHLLEKGLRVFPDDVKIRMALAFNLTYHHGEHEEAARLLQETARLKDAPKQAAELATRLLAHTGSFESALELTQSLLNNTDDETLRRVLERRLHEILLERELQKVDAAAARFHEQTGRRAQTIEELLAAKLLDAPPSDPEGGNFYFDATGRAQASSSKYRLDPIHKQRFSDTPPSSTP